METSSSRLAATTSRVAKAAMANKVPQITLLFWLVKITSTTVGETGADLLSEKLGWSLGRTSAVIGTLLLVVLLGQLLARRYVPALYWSTVLLVSVVGTLITDNLTDNLGVPLATTTVIFAITLAAVFAVWHTSERTLSIHTIVTSKREIFYWLTILFTFALGTAFGDLLAEKLGLGYGLSLAIFATAIALIAGAHKLGRMDAVLSFWLAYILTRPLGASLGDLLSQARADGGLGLGTLSTSAVFLVIIVVIVARFTVLERGAGTHARTRRGRGPEVAHVGHVYAAPAHLRSEERATLGEPEGM